MSVEIDVGLENAVNVKVPHGETQKFDLGPDSLVSSKLRTRLILGGVILLAALLGLYLYFHNRESTDDAQVDGHITPIAAKIYGRVAKVQVNDNQAVKAGQVLVQLDPADYQAALDQAKGALALAEGEARSAGVDVPRTTEDTASGTSRARVLQAQAGVASAHADVKRVAMRSADAQAKLAKVDQSRAQVEAAQLNLSYCSVVAPIDGVVTHKQVEDGQIVQQGQGLMVIVPLQDVWVTANFKETQLRAMKPGQKVEVSVDTYGKTFPGHVDSIAGATGAVLSLLPPENATGNYVKVVQRVPVKIVLDPIPPDKAILRPGMNVVATAFTN